MMELSAEQNAMLERLWEPTMGKILYDLFRAAPIPCKVNGKDGKAAFFSRDAQIVQANLIVRAALRELLLAVQERDARVGIDYLNEPMSDDEYWTGGRNYQEAVAKYVEQIRAQTYADLFPSTPKEL